MVSRHGPGKPLLFGARVVAPDLRGFGRSDTAPVDGPVTLVAHSMGCGVAMHLLVDHPRRVAALLLEAPVSPYGFGGTRDLTGTPTTPATRAPAPTGRASPPATAAC